MTATRIPWRFDRRFARDGKLTPEDMIVAIARSAQDASRALRAARRRTQARQGWN